MTHHKLILDEDLDEPFTLIAIHCTTEDYKLAYLLNQHLGTRFKRKKVDLEFSTNGLSIAFPLYDFEDGKKHFHYYLVANACLSLEEELQNSVGLFAALISEKATTHYLLPEFKNVDYFLKIYSENGVVPLRKMLSEINEIKQVISAYTVEVENIKSKNNLIFD